MTEVIGVRFRKAGTIYYFDPQGQSIERGSNVIVETARGVEYGKVEIGNREVPEESVTQPLKPIIRVATPEDDEAEAKNRDKEKDALVTCEEKIQKHGLEMKLIDCELTFDLNKIIFYFTADGRVDFRELVKELAAVFRMRIELRQIGPRDETKITNGMAICGRPLCCASFLTEFQPVSVKMAKDQNLSLNPTKISGICGRLMCCLKYEEDTYEYLNKDLPNTGDIVKTPDGTGEVMSVMILRQQVKVAVRRKPQDEPVVSVYPLCDIEQTKSKKEAKDEAKETPVPADAVE
ncbi:MAG: stage 0 sporulation family protein [Clostridiales bacterium]|jgi:cell fate regulator YaaT (PSP1 superfamily)|nr:stage 0 sporulation family protein [Clostridiales bacterium]